MSIAQYYLKRLHIANQLNCFNSYLCFTDKLGTKESMGWGPGLNSTRLHPSWFPDCRGSVTNCLVFLSSCLLMIDCTHKP